MSTPRPAMFVAIVPAPAAPHRADLSSRARVLGFAFSTVC